MRRIWLAGVLIGIGIVLQLTVLNGLRLPGGGVPDLVLVLVVALAMIEGPLPGMIIGFAAGLCLDLAPPGSELIGQYALVFCLAGWAAGRLSRAADRSAVRSVALVAIVAAAAEALSAAVGLALEPAQVTLAQVRQVLPATIGYDVLLCPFVLCLVVLASALLQDRLATGMLPGKQAGPASGKRGEQRKRQPLQPQLAQAAARSGDGWLGGGPRSQHRPQPPHRTAARLRPAAGVAGSASGLVRHRGRAATAPVHLRLSGRRRGDGAIGTAVGSGLASGRQPARHPGLLAGSRRGFRPHGGEQGGSAVRQRALTRPPSGRGRGPAPISFGSRRRGATAGRRLGSGWLTAASRPAAAAPRLRMSGSRSAINTRRRPALVPKVNFRTAKPAVPRRPASVPTFRRKATRIRPSAPTSGLVGGGALNAGTVRAARRHVGTPRLRLAGGRGPGMLGGSGGSPLRRPGRPHRGLGRSARRTRITSQPRFGYGRRSLLSFLTGRRIGGRWLARKRVGSRSGVWLISRRTGGTR